MANIDWMRYLGLAIGAVAVPVVAGNFAALSGILSNQLMAFNLMGITVGNVLLAGLGILGVDQFLFKK